MRKPFLRFASVALALMALTLGSSVSGGVQNTASGPNTIVIGGTHVSDNKNTSIAPQPPFP